MRAGTIAASIFNAKRTKKSDPLLSWTDFYKPLNEKPRIATAQKISATLDSFAAFAKARAKRKQNGKSR